MRKIAILEKNVLQIDELAYFFREKARQIGNFIKYTNQWRLATFLYHFLSQYIDLKEIIYKNTLITFFFQ